MADFLSEYRYGHWVADDRIALYFQSLYDSIAVVRQIRAQDSEAKSKANDYDTDSEKKTKHAKKSQSGSSKFSKQTKQSETQSTVATTAKDESEMESESVEPSPRLTKKKLTEQKKQITPESTPEVSPTKADQPANIKSGEASKVTNAKKSKPNKHQKQELQVAVFDSSEVLSQSTDAAKDESSTDIRSRTHSIDAGSKHVVDSDVESEPEIDNHVVSSTVSSVKTQRPPPSKVEPKSKHKQGPKQPSNHLSAPMHGAMQVLSLQDIGPIPPVSTLPTAVSKVKADQKALNTLPTESHGVPIVPAKIEEPISAPISAELHSPPILPAPIILPDFITGARKPPPGFFGSAQPAQRSTLLPPLSNSELQFTMDLPKPEPAPVPLGGLPMAARAAARPDFGPRPAFDPLSLLSLGVDDELPAKKIASPEIQRLFVFSL